MVPVSGQSCVGVAGVGNSLRPNNLPLTDKAAWEGKVGLCRQRSELSAWLCARQDFTEDVNCAFEFLLKLTPLLDKADQRCK